jgi:hypothetical protein
MNYNKKKMSGEKVFSTMMTERTNDGRGCVEDDSSCTGNYVYAVVDCFGNGYEFPAGMLGDVDAYVGEDGNGFVLCRLCLFTVH